MMKRTLLPVFACNSSRAATWHVIVSCFVLGMCSAAHADSTWDGSENDNWFNTNNWSAGVPDSTDIAFIPGDGTFPDITGSGSDAEARRILVGYNTSAILDITNGATLTTSQIINQPSYLGYNALGYAYLSGTGTLWSIQGSTPSNQAAIRIGYASPDETRGRLKVEDGAHVSIAGGAGIALWSWDQGFDNYLRSVIFIGSSGIAETGPGTLDAAWIEGDSGATADSELRFNHGDSNYYFTSDGTATGAAVEIRGQITVYHTGTGTTHITGANTYSGGTVISDGTLAISDNDNLGENAGPISFITPSETGTLYATSSFTNDHALVVSNSSGIIGVSGGETLFQYAPISGDEDLAKTGAGTFLHATNNTLSGTITIREGTLQIGDGTSRDGELGTGEVIIETGATLAFSHDGGFQSHSIINNLSGEGNVNIAGMNNYAFYGTNTYSGTTTIGTNNYLSIQNTNSIGTGDIAVNGRLYLETGTNMSLNNTLTGVGKVYLSDGTKVVYTNDSSFPGDVEIQNGSILRLGSGGAGGRFNTGSMALNDGILVLNRSDTFVFPNELVADGTVIIDGGCDVTFTGVGSNDYYDAVLIVSNGILRLSNGVQDVDTIDVKNGSTLDATVENEIFRIDVANGGILSPGQSQLYGDLTVYRLYLNDSSRMVFELGSAVDGTNDLIFIWEELELDGFVDVVALDGFGAGEYPIVELDEDYNVFTNKGVQVGNMPAGYEGSLMFDNEVLYLTVSELSGLEMFRSTYGLNPDGSDDLQDWSTNGVENVSYYLFGLGDPNTVPVPHTIPGMAVPGLPAIGRDGETNPVAFSYTRLVDADTEGITYTPQTATNLSGAAPWMNLSSLTGDMAPAETNIIPVDANYEIVELQVSGSAPTSYHFRVHIDVVE